MTSYQLVSLADMLKLPIAKLIGAVSQIIDFGRTTHDGIFNHPNEMMSFPANAYGDLQRNIQTFCDACEQMDLKVSLRAGRELQTRVNEMTRPDGTGVIAHLDLGLLSNHASATCACLYHEADTKIAIGIPVDKEKYFDPNEPLFGKAVLEIFPVATDDIQDAGRCLAFGQGTATVMHLMRVAEVGLKTLATALDIPYAASWEQYLKQIHKQIDAPHVTKSRKWKKNEKFFRDVSGDLMTIKQAWRNPTMHVDRKYYPDEAEVIFGAVRTLMQTLAEGLPQKNKAGK